MILGIDEVGRGCWAGPLVIGAVVLGGAEIKGLTDSKVLGKKRREALSQEIIEQASGVGLGWVSATEVDEIGLSAALSLAAKRAVQMLNCAFHEIIIDGTVNFLRQTPLEPHVTLMKKADLLVPSVSAASIVAKVARDDYMAQLDECYLGYNFKTHVGYGTAAHRSAIAKLGATPEHRLSFAPLAAYRVADKSASVVSIEEPINKLPTTRSVGDASETAAAEKLKHLGHSIIERNWKTKYCEIDIVSKKDDTYYFVEVKHRRDSRTGDGLAAITPKKLAQMHYATRFYAHVHKLQADNLRLMAIATAGTTPIVSHITEII